MADNAESPSSTAQMLADSPAEDIAQHRISNVAAGLDVNDISGKTNSLKRKQVEDDKVENSSVKFPKLEAFTTVRVSLEKAKDASPVSPWEMHRIRGQLVEANLKVKDLEYQISRHHSLRNEMELLFQKEKDSLQAQIDKEKSMGTELSSRLQVIGKREAETKQELVQCKIRAGKDKINFDEHIQCLQRENAKLKDITDELTTKTQNEKASLTRHIQFLKADLTEKDQHLLDVQNRNADLEEHLHDALQFQAEFEQLAQELQNSQLRIKELEKEHDDHLESAALAKSQQEKVLHYPELEKEVASLKEQNKNLKESFPNISVLEEMVQHLKTREAVSEEQGRDLAWTRGHLSHLQTVVEEWHKVARDCCEECLSSSHPPDANIVKKKINELQQRVHVLTADLADLKSQLNETRQRKDLLTVDLKTAKRELAKFRTTGEQQNTKMRLIQKKLQLATMERDSYRSQLDFFEKNLTISHSSPANRQSQQQQQMQNRIETMQKILDQYHTMMKQMEMECEKSKGSIGSVDLTEKLYRLECERNTLLQEKEQLQKHKDKLEMQLEYSAMKQNVNPGASKILHFRMNPTAEAEAQYEDEVTKLRAKCSCLEERVKLLEEENVQDITHKVEENVASSDLQEVKDLQEIVNNQEIEMQGLKDVFQASAKEFQQVCYELFGYQMDQNENIYKLSSVYAESPDDHLMFKRMPDGTFDMMETPYSATLEELIELHLHQNHSLPLFLGAVTSDLYNQQAMPQTLVLTCEEDE